MSHLVRLTTLPRCLQPAILRKGLLAMVPNSRSVSSVFLATEDKREDQNRVCELYGDNLIKKQKNNLRIGFLNIGGLPFQQDSFKDQELRQGLTALDFDIFGIAEMNIDWRTIPEQDRLYSRTREWWESSHLSISSNTATPPVDR
jgi:hypothetical protein